MNTPEISNDVQKPHKPSAKKRPKKRVAATKSAPPPEMAGLDVATCATACSATRCVISGMGICAHPNKGGLQANMQSPEAARRLNEAKRVIGKRKLDVAAEL